VCGFLHCSSTKEALVLQRKKPWFSNERSLGSPTKEALVLQRRKPWFSNEGSLGSPTKEALAVFHRRPPVGGRARKLVTGKLGQSFKQIRTGPEIRTRPAGCSRHCAGQVRAARRAAPIPRCNAVAPKRDGGSRCRAASIRRSSGAYHPPMSPRARIGLIKGRNPQAYPRLGVLHFYSRANITAVQIASIAAGPAL
jgi:hypothetical protein